MKNHYEIKVTTKRGYTLNCIDGDTITKAIQAHGEYDTNTLESLADILGKIKPNISLDIGANIGNHAVLIARCSQRLIAFEPVKLVYDLLKSNLNQNSPANTLAVNKGLSNEYAIREIFIPAFNLGCSSLEVQVGDGEKTKIDLLIGDDWLKTNFEDQQIDFIKMDIEGHEAAALLGLEENIRKYQPLVLLEWKSQITINAFREKNLFPRLFKNYAFYSLTQTDSKKVYKRSLLGYFERLYFKLSRRSWCLTNFQEQKAYSNVYFVPDRYKELFKALPFKPTVRE
jgi:FkbM family methyltransferase